MDEPKEKSLDGTSTATTHTQISIEVFKSSTPLLTVRSLDSLFQLVTPPHGPSQECAAAKIQDLVASLIGEGVNSLHLTICRTPSSYPPTTQLQFSVNGPGSTSLFTTFDEQSAKPATMD